MSMSICHCNLCDYIIYLITLIEYICIVKYSNYDFWQTELLGKKKKGKDIRLTSYEGPKVCKTSKLPHSLDNRLIYGGEAVRLSHRPPFSPRKILGTHFCQRLSRPQGHSAVGRIRYIEKSNNLIGIRTRDFSACSVMLQPTTLPRAPKITWVK
jgi:hypothetical protein